MFLPSPAVECQKKKSLLLPRPVSSEGFIRLAFWPMAAAARRPVSSFCLRTSSDFQTPGSLVLRARRESIAEGLPAVDAGGTRLRMLSTVLHVLAPLRRTATATTSIMSWVWSAAKLELPPARRNDTTQLEPEPGTPCPERPSSTASRSTP